MDETRLITYLRDTFEMLGQLFVVLSIAFPFLWKMWKGASNFIHDISIMKDSLEGVNQNINKLEERVHRLSNNFLEHASKIEKRIEAVESAVYSEKEES